MKRLLLSLLLFSNISAAKFDNFFFRDSDGKVHKVNSVDPIIRDIPIGKINYALKHMNIAAVKEDDNSYSLRAFSAGPGGATVGFLSGKALIYGLGHGTISLISWGIGIFCPPAGVATQLGLTAILSAPIEAASNVVGLGTGIVFGAATGPV